MNRLVVLDFAGTLDEGFRVSLEIGQDGQQADLRLVHHLPPQPDLVSYAEQWQLSQSRLDITTRIKPKAVYSGSIQSRRHACQQSAHHVSDRLTNWLQSDLFLPLNERMREVLNLEDNIRVLIRTDCPTLHRLPWHEWNFFERYQSAEYALCLPNAERSMATPLIQSPRLIRVLVILGDATGINIERDRHQFEQLAPVGAEVEFLVEPTREELTDQLWNQPWDILGFCGHSRTEQKTGRIYINPQESLTLTELKYGLRNAIAQGLQLAIFNSCDGLGLAYSLAQLNIPQLMVMRAPVPDRVAQEFLRHFLVAFSGGRSLYLAERYARERLQSLEGEFPCASWLPVIVQNSTERPPTWQDLRQRTGGRISGHQWAKIRVATALQAQFLSWKNFRDGLPRMIMIAVLTTSLIVGVRSLGWLQPSELHAYDRLMQLRPAEAADDRFLLVTIDEGDRQFQREAGMNLQDSFADEALAQFLSKINPYQPAIVGLAILRDQDLSPELTEQMQATHHLLGVCEVNTQDGSEIPPPQTLSSEQAGISNTPHDPDSVVRRQYITISPGRKCSTEFSFSFLVAQTYLQEQEFPGFKRVSPTLGTIGGQDLVKLPHHAGGYQLPVEEAQGYQLMLNYRATDPLSIPFREFLQGMPDQTLDTLIRDRIVLIGTVTQTELTPLGNQPSQQKSGLHRTAHEASQVISAVIDQRSLIWWWTEWQEVLWIWVWAFVGTAIAFIQRSQWQLGLFTMIASLFLSLFCYFVFQIGGWIPLVPAFLALIITSVITVIHLNQIIYSIASKRIHH